MYFDDRIDTAEAAPRAVVVGMSNLFKEQVMLISLAPVPTSRSSSRVSHHPRVHRASSTARDAAIFLTASAAHARLARSRTSPPSHRARPITPRGHPPSRARG